MNRLKIQLVVSNRMYRSCLLDAKAVIAPGEMLTAAADVDGFITNQLRTRLEGKCCPQGYIQKNSISLLSRTIGAAENAHFTGNFVYLCAMQCNVLYPAKGNVFTVEILKVNKMGAYAAFEESLRILLPRDMHLGNSQFDSLKPGDMVQVEVLKTRFQAHDPFIMAVGSLKDIPATPE